MEIYNSTNKVNGLFAMDNTAIYTATDKHMFCLWLKNGAFATDKRISKH